MTREGRMMSKGLDTRAMERRNVDSFIQHYRVKTGQKLRVVTHDNKPDFLVECATEGWCWGIEVTMAIFADSDSLAAKKAFERPGTIMPQDAPETMSRREIIDRYIGNPFDAIQHSATELIRLISERIEVKCKKAVDYNTNAPLILVVGIGDGVFGIPSVERFRNQLLLPLQTPFREIWVNSFLSGFPDGNGILRLA